MIRAHGASHAESSGVLEGAEHAYLVAFLRPEQER